MPPLKPLLPAWASKPPLLKVRVCMGLMVTPVPVGRFKEFTANDPLKVSDAPSTVFAAPKKP